MIERFINVGKKSFVNADEVEIVVSANAEKVRRFLNKWHIDKDNMQIVNLTSDKETRSMIVFKSGRIVLSSVNASKLAQRGNTDGYLEE